MATVALPRHLARLYEVLGELATAVGGGHRLELCTGTMDWPQYGVYFFFSPDTRLDETPPVGWHVTRVGTVGARAGSGNTLWTRLRRHRGTLGRGKYPGGGNHRASVFRKHVGDALIEREGLQDEFPTWGDGIVSTSKLRELEHDLECYVSDYIRQLPFLWLNVPGSPKPNNTRAFIESNAIALLSRYQSEVLGDNARTWLGHYSPTSAIRESGLWNVNFVGNEYDPNVIDLITEYIPISTTVDD